MPIAITVDAERLQAVWLLTLLIELPSASFVMDPLLLVALRCFSLMLTMLTLPAIPYTDYYRLLPRFS
jgi:hypothetical protein